MANYKDSILRHEKELNFLHQELRQSFKQRRKTKAHHDAWHKVAAAFRNYHSTVDDWLLDIGQNDICDWADARDFTFQYIEIDPFYFRSGYAKEKLIRKIKPCSLTPFEAEILRRLIIKRIQSGAFREFRKFCQLIPRIQNETFIDKIQNLAKAKDKSVSIRAMFTMQYLAAT